MGKNIMVSHLIVLLANVGFLPTVPKLEFLCQVIFRKPEFFRVFSGKNTIFIFLLRLNFRLCNAAVNYDYTNH